MVNLKPNITMNLSAKSLKTLEALKLKSNNDFLTVKSRMPRLSSVSALLNEVGVKHYLGECSNYRFGKSASSRYFTYGGSREYKGYNLSVHEIKLNIDSTEDNYSYYSKEYAHKLVELVNKYL